MIRPTLALALALALFGSAGAFASVPTYGDVALPHTPCENLTEFAQLNASTDMPASIGSMLVKIPYEVLFPFASQVQYWPSWNPLFLRVNVSELKLCGAFPADYTNAPQLPFPKNIVGPHQIVQLHQGESSGVMAWEFKILDNDRNGEVITFGRHQMRFDKAESEGLSNSFTLFKSFEKAAGSLVKPYQFAWTVALQQSLIDTTIGLSCLEQVYLRTGGLNPRDVVPACKDLPPVDLAARFNSFL